MFMCVVIVAELFFHAYCSSDCNKILIPIKKIYTYPNKYALNA